MCLNTKLICLFVRLYKNVFCKPMFEFMNTGLIVLVDLRRTATCLNTDSVRIMAILNAKSIVSARGNMV